MGLVGVARPWLKVAEFAEISGFDIQTVRRALRSGELRGFKVGRQWLIPLEQFENAPKMTAND